MNTAKVEIADQPVVRLTIELSNTHAAELAGLLGHVSFLNFPWAKSIYDALKRADIRCADVFMDWEHGPDIYLQRKPARPSRNG